MNRLAINCLLSLWADTSFTVTPGEWHLVNRYFELCSIVLDDVVPPLILYTIVLTLRTGGP